MGPGGSLRFSVPVLAQIRFFHFLVGQQLRAGAGHGDVSRLQHVGQVRDLQRHVGVLLDQQHGDALAVDLPDDGEDVLHHQGRKAQGGLIQHHQLGAGHQRPAHGQHLLLAAGERAGQLPAALLQTGEQLVDPLEVLLDLRLVLAQVCADLQVLHHRQVRKDPAPLGAHGDAGRDDLVDGLAQQLLAVPEDGPGAGLHQAGDGAQGGGLAGAVGADQRDDLAVGHLQRDAPEGLDAAVADMEVFDFKHLPPPPDTRR